MPDSSDTPFRPGAVWLAERGKLYRFTTEDAVVVKPWPKPQAWRKRAGKGWTPAAPLIDLSVANGGTNYGERMAWGQVPKDVRDAVCRASFAGFQWSSLSMIARCPGALELAQQDPMLAAMLAIGNRVRPVPVSWLHRSVRALLKHPDRRSRLRRIQAWLDVDTSRSFLRLTRKSNLPGHHWRWHHWKLILDLWAVPRGRKLLQHLPEVTPDHAEFIEVLRRIGTIEQVAEMIHPNLMREISDQGIFGGACMIAHDVVGIWPLVWADRPLPLFRDLDHLERVRTEVNLAYEFAHRRELGEEQQRRQAVLDALKQGTSAESLFPPPPLAGSDTILPLRTPKALIREGISMGHCLKNDHWKLSACMALGYGYHADHAGERATLWLGRTQETPLGFRIEQIQGPHNHPPSQAMVAHVVLWFRHHEQWATYRQEGGLRPSGEEPEPLADIWTRALPPRPVPLDDDEIPF